MNEINRRAKTMQRWEELLMPIEYEAIQDIFHNPKPEAAYTPNEVLDAIVEWEGGIATGYHLRSLISRVYSVEL